MWGWEIGIAKQSARFGVVTVELLLYRQFAGSLRVPRRPCCVDARKRARRMPASITLQGPPLFAGITSKRWVSDKNLGGYGDSAFFHDVQIKRTITVIPP